MAPPDVLQLEQDFLMWQSIFDNPKGESVVKSKGTNIEKKMEFLENLTGKVSNRRTRRWMNDRLLMELVPRLNAEEIRGLFAPPPWGDDVPLSAFCMTNSGDWDKIRSIDMDKEESMLKSFEDSQPKLKNGVDADKAAVITAWHRVDSRTRDAIRRKFLPELITIYEDCVREFIKGSGDTDVLELNVQDSFQRLLLHGVCEFYNLVSVTTTLTKGKETLKMTKISKKKKKAASDAVMPVITLCNFLKMAKEGIW